MRTDARINARLGAALAMSNLGHEVPTNVAERPEHWMPDAYGEVCGLAGHLMESYEHEEIFAEEAAGWANRVRKMGYREVQRVYPYEWVKNIIEAGKVHL